MDCRFAGHSQQQQQPIQRQPLQQQQQQKQNLNSIHCLDESLEALTKLAQETLAQCEISENNQTLKNYQAVSSTSPLSAVKLRKHSDRALTATTTTTTTDAKSHTYRISMANLEETQESELDVILGELSFLEAQMNCCDNNFLPANATHGIVMGTLKCESNSRTHSRTNSTISTCISESSSSMAPSTCSSSSGVSENGLSSSGGATINLSAREPRTESPDNDSAFSDTVSLLSSESSVSSNSSSNTHMHSKQYIVQQQKLQMQKQNSSKAAKIQLALEKLEHASIRRLFVKAFTADGASKSLLVDERMTCAHVTRLLADKNHVQMQPYWALIENLGDLQMERLFEDHELLVDNLMNWNSDAGNRVLFQQRADKLSLFVKPEIFLPGPQMAPGSQHDEHTRAMLLEEFFESNSQLQVDGPLFMKVDAKKGWKRYHCVLRSSGLYYFPKEKTKNTRDLACLTLFNGNNVYYGIGWKKKCKAPTDYTFAFKSATDTTSGKNCRTLKMLCAEDMETMEKWITAIRISKYGKQLWHNYKLLIEDLNGSDTMSQNSFAVSMRSESISSISSAVPSQCGSVSSAISTISTLSNSSSSGRASRASSSSSSGCMSDDNNAFDSEFTTGTIKRKPSMKPNLPLTSMTRQLKEVGEITISSADNNCLNDDSSPERSGTLTRHHNRRKSQESNSSGTLKRRTPANIQQRSPVTPTQQSIDIVDSSGVNQCMSVSTLSLDSLPPPPSPPPVGDDDAQELYGSHLSLASLPPPPPPDDMIQKHAPAVPEKPKKVNSTRTAPPYKAPPEYKKNCAISEISEDLQPQTVVQKKVSFADSPVLLRRKMCSPEPKPKPPPYMPASSLGFLPTTTTTTTKSSGSTLPQDFGSPKRLQESTSNPPRDFLKDLQRVMRKKWQVAQKCKQEPATMPHEVLGFRDFSSEELLAHNLCAKNSGRGSSHYYRETANVSNWVQEHYGTGATIPPSQSSAFNEYALYENVPSNNSTTATTMHYVTNAGICLSTNVVAGTPARIKRPPPPPPKRSDSTQLTHRM